MGDYCVTTVADGIYRDYVPLFLYCLGKSYPEYRVLVFVRGGMTDNLARGLALLEGDQWKVVTSEFDGYPQTARMGASLRCLLFTENRARRYFSDFDGVYVGDVDMIHTREQPTLMEQHLRHADACDLEYSNMRRDSRVPKLTGGHFVTRRGLEMLVETVTKYDRRVRAGGLTGCLISPGIGAEDEQLWFCIVQDSGQEVLPQHNLSEDPGAWRAVDPASCDEVWFAPWHGLNLGYMQGKRAPERYEALAAQPYIQGCLHGAYLLSCDDLFWELAGLMSAGGQKALQDYGVLFAGMYPELVEEWAAGDARFWEAR